MCEYCENVRRSETVGRTYYDDDGNYCELAWFLDNPMPTLQVKSDGNWSCVMVPRCPMCGRDLMGGHVDELEAALRRACEFAAKVSGSCPLDMFDYQANDCEFACEDQYAECWRRYFERGDEE